jgi:hypothetical protein
MRSVTSLTVRRVAHESEAAMLLDFLQTNLPNLPHRRRFEWLYRANPDGPAWSWFVCAGSGEVVGAASLFPRAMWLGQQQQRCAQVGDFAISANHRSLGPALLLQRATFSPVDQGDVAFCYDCPPHEAGMSTFRRLGMKPNCRIDRYAVPLRVDRRLRKQLGIASKVPAAAGNLVLRLRRCPVLQRRSNGLVIDDHSGSFGDEFSHLDRVVAKPEIIRSQRSAAHLNWRYREDPLGQYHILTARRAGELVAFVVCCESSHNISIVDLFGRDLAEASISLLAAIMERFGKSHQTVEVYLSSENELIEPFSRMGFRLRSPAAHVVAYAAPQNEISGVLANRSAWGFTQAEIRA